jgi:hypothetical protein
MIKSRSEMNPKGLEIDLSGPDGNAFVLMGIATRLSKQMGKDHKPIIEEMMSSDYENLLEVFEANFGDYVILYR